MAFYHGLFISLIGMIFVLSMFLQIASMSVTSTSTSVISNVKPSQIALSVLLSIVATRLVVSVRSVESISSKIGATRFEKIQTNPLSDFIAVASQLVISAGLVGFVFITSEIIHSSNISLYEGFRNTINGGVEFDFFLLLFLYITIAGSIASAISSLLLARYQSLPWTLGLHTWIRRILFFVVLKIRPNSPELKDTLEQRCPQCCNDSLVVSFETDDNREYICKLCGLSERDHESFYPQLTGSEQLSSFSSKED